MGAIVEAGWEAIVEAASRGVSRLTSRCYRCRSALLFYGPVLVPKLVVYLDPPAPPVAPPMPPASVT